MSTFWTIVTAILAGSAGGTLMSALAARRNARIAAEFAEYASQRQSARNAAERAMVAHATAAEALADDAAVIYRTLDAIASTVVGPDVDYYDPEGHLSVHATQAVLDALVRLRTIWTRHPTAEVRAAAHGLYDKLKTFYGNPPGDGRDWPSVWDSDDLLAIQRERIRWSNYFTRPQLLDSLSGRCPILALRDSPDGWDYKMT